MIIMGSAYSEYLGSALYANVLLAYSPKSDALYRMIWIGLSSFITGLLPQDMLLYCIVYSPFRGNPDFTNMRLIAPLDWPFSGSALHAMPLLEPHWCEGLDNTTYLRLPGRLFPWAGLHGPFLFDNQAKTDALSLQLYFLWLRIPLLVLIHLLF